MNQRVLSQTFIPSLGEKIITVITFDTLSPNTMYVGTGSDFSSGETGGIFRSTDSGATWDTLLLGVTVRDIDIHPQNSNIIYAALGINFLTKAGVVKSYDKGATWVKADSGIYSDFEVGPSQLAIDPKYPETLYIGTAGIWNGKFYKSTNGGISWSSRGDSTHLAIGPTSLGINSDSSNVIYAGTNQNGYIMKSSDYGESWNYTGLADGVTRIIKFNSSPNIVFVGSSTERHCGFFQSANGGESWTNIDGGIIDPVFDVHSIEFTGYGESKKIFITGNTHEYKPRIYYKHIDEPRWKVLSIDSTVVQFYTMTIYNEKLWIGSWGGLYVLEVPTTIPTNPPQQLPNEFTLYPGFPNPFNGSVKIRFAVPTFSGIALEIFDSAGRYVKNLYKGTIDRGTYEIAWDGKNKRGEIVSSGTYFVRLHGDKNQRTQKLMLVK